nr:VanW family protein [Clostridia bacterium]
MEKIKREDIEKKENQRQSEVINIMKVSKDIQLSQDTQVFKFVKDMDYTKNNKNNIENKNLKNIENKDLKSTQNKYIYNKNNNEIKMNEKNVIPKNRKNEINKNIKVEKEKNNGEKENSTGNGMNNKKIEAIKRENIPQYNNYQEKNVKKDYNNYQEKNSEKNSEKNKETKKVLITVLILVFLILFIVIFSTVFSLININSNKIIKGVFINTIEVSNLSKNEAIEKLENELNNNEKNYITINYKQYKKKLSLQDINGKFDINESVNKAYNLGREKDIVQNNYKILGSIIFKSNIDINFTYDEELLEKVINEIEVEIPEIALDSTYLIQGNKLIIKNGKDGIQIKKDEFIKSVIKSFTENKKEFEIQTEHCKKKEIDIEKIHSEIYKKPKNAYYTTNPYRIYKEEIGLDFDMSIEQAKKLLLEDKDEYEIQLKTINPQIKLSDLDSGAYPDLLSTFTTKYGTSDANRNTNIALAAKSINSVVLMPGETFSYNDLIGECSTKTGYKAATIYLNGELSTGIGGGICQVSTTLYNAVIRANLEIVERRNHSLGVTYVPSGQDAMVSIGTQDFKFKNNRDYPIKVVAYVGTGSITCQVYGLKQDTEYEVKLYSRTVSKTDTKYKVETYKLLYLNGVEISRTWLSTDTYKIH